VRLLAILVVALALVRGSLGAILDAPGIGPDERGHLQYLQTFAAGGWAGVQGVEARQPPTGYLPTLAAWWFAGGPTDPQAQVFAPVSLSGPALAARLVSVAWSGVTAWATWQLAQAVWPSRPWTALLALILASMAPGYLYVMASVTNEPAATTIATVTILAAARATTAPAGARRARLLGWAVAAVVAVATKLTNVPIAVATGAVIAWSLRATWRPWFARRPVRLAAWAVAAVAVAAYGAILTRHPSSSYAATAARAWPEAVVVGTVAFVRDGAATEALRTFWHAWDYDVAWPAAIDAPVTAVLGAAVLLGAAGAILGTVSVAVIRAAAPGTANACLWFPVIAQVAFAVVRYGIGTVAGAAMGGAAQAKTFFPAIAPASILGAAGLAVVVALVTRALTGRLRGIPATGGDAPEDAPLVRLVTVGAIACLVAADVAGLAASTWRHARWAVPDVP
jgi:hypothetical protein